MDIHQFFAQLMARMAASTADSLEFKAGKADRISKLYAGRLRTFEFLFTRVLANKKAAERKSIDMLAQTIFEDIWPRIEPVLIPPKRTPRYFTPVSFTGGMEIFSPSPQPIVTSVDIYLPTQLGSLVFEDCLIAGFALSAQEVDNDSIDIFTAAAFASPDVADNTFEREGVSPVGRGFSLDSNVILGEGIRQKYVIAFGQGRLSLFHRGLIRPFDVWCSGGDTNSNSNSSGSDKDNPISLPPSRRIFFRDKTSNYQD